MCLDVFPPFSGISHFIMLKYPDQWKLDQKGWFHQGWWLAAVIFSTFAHMTFKDGQMAHDSRKKSPKIASNNGTESSTLPEI